jgi:hypothetical protein
MTIGSFKLARRAVSSLTVCGLASASVSIAGDVASVRGFDDNRQFELEHDSLTAWRQPL